ncbi:MAG: penicillin-binding protein [Deltaproteobacteria bacterium]|nr:penicillin-binding protein [Deltaproteobacteria bacterium]
MKSRRRNHLVVAGAVAITGAAVFVGTGFGSSSPPPAAEIGATGSALDTAAFVNLADKVAIAPAAAPKPAIPNLAVDLDKIVRDGDRYYAPLPDGKRATLTLDPNMQALAEKLLDESRAPRGGIVVMAPDGRILALAGRRTAEPKGGLSGTIDRSLATQPWAPAASIFKLVTAAALVDAGVDPAEKVCYHGGLRAVQDHNLKDDPKRDGRCDSLAYGIAHSQNAIVGKLAFQKLEPKKLEAEAKLLGWAGAYPELQAQVGGELMMGSARDLEFAQAAAGFSNTKLSALGGAVLAGTFAASGAQPVPRLVDAIDGVAVPGAPARRTVSPDTAAAVAKMMAGTCDKGSAARSFGGRRDNKVAGKTGTLTREEPFYMEHSWFVGFAPQQKPQVIVSVVLGNPESWHLRGHEAARRLIDRFLSPRPRAKGHKS